LQDQEVVQPLQTTWLASPVKAAIAVK